MASLGQRINQNGLQLAKSYPQTNERMNIQWDCAWARLSPDKSHQIAAKAFQMRDIAGDLKERIETTQSELALTRTEYEAAKRDLEEKYFGRYNRVAEKLKALEFLFSEETGISFPLGNANNNSSGIRLPLPDFIINSLVTSGAKSKEEIRELAARAGYGDDASVGRVVHTTLLNLSKAGRIVELPNARYDAVKINMIL